MTTRTTLDLTDGVRPETVLANGFTVLETYRTIVKAREYARGRLTEAKALGRLRVSSRSTPLRSLVEN